MSWKRFVIATLLAAAGVASIGAQPTPDDARTVENLRKALLQLPYYGVFDFLAFRYDKGTVTLSGFAYRPSLRKEAAEAVRRVARVDQVVNNIEQLRLSPHDDAIRWATFYRIYYDSSLSRYAPGGGLGGFNRRFDMLRYPGMEPLGMYPIHIIVNRGRTLLVGVVDSDADRTLAAIRAREVPGTLGVETAIEVVNESGTR